MGKNETTKTRYKEKFKLLRINIPKRSEKIINFRVTHEKNFIEKGIDQPIKTSILLDKAQFPSSLAYANVNYLQHIPSYRMIRAILKVSPLNSPVEVETAKGSRLKRTTKIGGLSIFSNRKNQQPCIHSTIIHTLPKRTKFLNTAQYQWIVPTKKMKKKKNINLKKSQLEKEYQKSSEVNFKRNPTQNRVMARKGVSEKKGSATAYVHAAKIFKKDLNWEWLHLIAHSFSIEKAQFENNLVAGTTYANTEMLFAEHSLHYLANQYPKGIKLNVEATLIPKTQIATHIHYHIKTKDFEFAYIFNAQQINKPHIDYQRYFEYIIKELCRLSKQKNKPPVNKKFLLTYTKDNLPFAKINKKLLPKMKK